MRGARFVRTTKEELMAQLQQYSTQRKKFVSYITHIQNRWRSGEISYENYGKIIQEKHHGKTLSEWIQHYENGIEKLERKIRNYWILSSSGIIVKIFLFILFLGFLFFLFFKGPTLLGFVFQGDKETFTQNLGLEFQESGVYEWKLENLGQLLSVHLSGSIEGEGNVKIYLDDLLILNSDKIEGRAPRGITGQTVEGASSQDVERDEISSHEDQSLSSSEEKAGEVPPLETSPSQETSPSSENLDASESSKEEIEDALDKEEEKADDLIEENKTEEIEKKEDEKIDEEIEEPERKEDAFIKEFKEICEETCDLKELRLNKSSYLLRIEITNAQLKIDEIVYEISGKEEKEDDRGEKEKIGVPGESEEKEGLPEIPQNITEEINKTKEIPENVSEEIVKNITEPPRLILDIPNIEIQKNTYSVIKIQDYFENVEEFYLLQAKNISTTTFDHTIKLVPDKEFLGTISLKIIVGNEHGQAESNFFNISVSELVNEPTLIKDVPTIKILKNNFSEIDITKYFAGAERYYLLQTKNISTSVYDHKIRIEPDENFVGIRTSQIIAENELGRTESNLFDILVSDTITEIPEIPNDSLNISTRQYKAVINKPTKWIKIVDFGSLNETSGANIELPKEAKNISIKTGREIDDALIELEDYEEIIENSDREDLISGAITGNVALDIKEGEGILTGLWRWIRGFSITGNVIREEDLQENIIETAENKVIDVGDIAIQSGDSEIAVEYYTQGPRAIEEELRGRKRIIVSGEDELNYTDVLSYAEIPETLGVGQESQLRIYWREEGKYVNFSAYDLDANGKIDYVEWIVPHLSNQTFDIILITKADHLDENRTFISDIYDHVKELDGNWSEEIANNEYVRVTFEKNLTSKNDITVYPRIVSGMPRIEIYEIGEEEIIAEFESLIGNEYNKVFLKGLNGEQESFDLKIINGSVEFDHIIDPDQGTCATLSTANAIYNITANLSSTATCLTVTANNVTIDGQGFSILYGTAGSSDSYGVYSNGANDTTVKNFFEIKKQANNVGTGMHGIYFFKTYNGSAFNNTLIVNGTSSNGVTLTGAVNITVYSNIINTSSSADGIALNTLTNYSVIRDNKINVSGAAGDGISLTSAFNISVMHNTIVSRNTGHGILVTTGTNNSLISYNNLTNLNLSDGIALSGGSKNNTIAFNIINATGARDGISLAALCTNNSIMNNVINASAVGGDGIVLSSTTNNTIAYNTITTLDNGVSISLLLATNTTLISYNNMSSLSSGSGIIISLASRKNTVSFNHITSNLDDAIVLGTAGANDWIIDSNIILSIDNDGILLSSTHNHSILFNDINISTSSGSNAGIRMTTSSNNNFTGNTIMTNQTGSGVSLAGPGSTNNTFVKNRINTSSGDGIIMTSAFNATFYEGSIEGGTGSGDNDIDFSANSVGFLNLTNVSLAYNEKVFNGGTTSQLNILWYVDAYVNYSNGTLAADANVSAWNASGDSVFSTTTGADGFIPRQIVLESWRNSSDYVSHNNHTINASKAGVQTNMSKSLNISMYRNESFTLVLATDSTAPLVTINVPGNLTYNKSSLNFNVSLNENGSVMYSLNDGVNNVSMLYSADQASLFGNVFNSTNNTIADGSYTFRVYANDTAGNKNYTESIVFSVAATNITYCGTLSNANRTYYLENNVSTGGTCFTVTANNVTINCAGYTINYSINNVANTYGVYSDGANSTIVKHCRIFDGDNSTSGDGIYFLKSHNGSIYNNTVVTYVDDTITLDNSNYTNITSNNLTFYQAVGGDNLRVDASSYNIIENNNMSNPNTGVALRIQTNSRSNRFYNNTIYSTSASTAIFITTGGNTNNSFESMKVFHTGTGGSSDGMTIGSGNNTLTVRDSILNATRGYPFDVSVGTFGAASGEYNFTNVSDDTFINFSTEWLDGANGTLNVHWYVDAISNYSNGSVAPSANISAFNISRDIALWSVLTSASGIMAKQTVLEYTQTNTSAGSSTTSYYGNHTFNGTNPSGGTNLTQSWNMTQNRYLVFQFTAGGNVAPTITTVFNHSVIGGALVEGPSRSNFIVNFSVIDADGVADLNSATASLNFTRVSETPRYNTTCMQYQSAGTSANYTCNVTMWWWDGAGAWNINASILDLNSNTGVNNTVTFGVSSTTGFILGPGNLTFGTLTAGAINSSASNDPVTLNNTGNVDIVQSGVSVNATNLVGETDSNKALYSGNFSVGNQTGTSVECGEGTSTQMNYTVSGGSFVNVTNAILNASNYTLNNLREGQEELYVCVRLAGSELTQQAYSTRQNGAWTIQILLAAFILGKRRKGKKKNDDKLLQAATLIIDEIRDKYSLSKAETLELVMNELQKKYEITQKEVRKALGIGELVHIPLDIFSKELGGLEALCKYMKENLSMNYRQIAKRIHRDERTVWTAYHKAKKKVNDAIEVTDAKITVPLTLFSGRSFTVLESLIIYLRGRGMKFSEIAQALHRDPRNIQTIYSRAVKKGLSRGL